MPVGNYRAVTGLARSTERTVAQADAVYHEAVEGALPNEPAAARVARTTVLTSITLRPLAEDDLDALFVWESDPRAVEMAAFTRANPSDRSEFEAHYERIRKDSSAMLRAIDNDGEFVGTVGSFTMEGERDVWYWIAPARWGQGLASGALRAFLAIEPTRPIYARVAEHNVASAKVLARTGFIEVGSETSFAAGVGAEIVERIYRLDH